MSKNFVDYLQEVADVCIQCGICTQLCDNYRDDSDMMGVRALEITNYINSNVGSIDEIDPTLVYAVGTCNMCDRCIVDCPVGINAFGTIKSIREYFTDLDPDRLWDYRTLRADYYHNSFSMTRELMGETERPLNYQGVEKLFFPGCSLSSYSPEITHAAFDLLQERGLADGYSYECCGLLLSTMGSGDIYTQYQKDMARALFIEGDVKTIIAGCTNCYYEFKHLKSQSFIKEAGIDFEVEHLAQVLVDEKLYPVPDTDNPPILSFHDSCSDRWDKHVANAIRELFKNYPQEEIEMSKQNSYCCGSGGMISMVDHDVHLKRTAKRMSDFEKTQAHEVVSACASCVKSFHDECESTIIPTHYLEYVTGIRFDFDKVFQVKNRMFGAQHYDETMAKFNDTKKVFSKKD